MFCVLGTLFSENRCFGEVEPSGQYFQGNSVLEESSSRVQLVFVGFCFGLLLCVGNLLAKNITGAHPGRGTGFVF